MINCPVLDYTVVGPGIANLKISIVALRLYPYHVTDPSDVDTDKRISCTRSTLDDQRVSLSPFVKC